MIQGRCAGLACFALSGRNGSRIGTKSYRAKGHWPIRIAIAIEIAIAIVPSEATLANRSVFHEVSLSIWRPDSDSDPDYERCFLPCGIHRYFAPLGWGAHILCPGGAKMSSWALGAQLVHGSHDAAGGGVCERQEFGMRLVVFPTPVHFQLDRFLVGALGDGGDDLIPIRLADLGEGIPVVIPFPVVVVEVEDAQSGTGVLQKPCHVAGHQGMPGIEGESDVVGIEGFKGGGEGAAVVFEEVVVLQRDHDAEFAGDRFHAGKAIKKSLDDGGGWFHMTGDMVDHGVAPETMGDVQAMLKEGKGGGAFILFLIPEFRSFGVAAVAVEDLHPGLVQVGDPLVQRFLRQGGGCFPVVAEVEMGESRRPQGAQVVENGAFGKGFVGDRVVGFWNGHERLMGLIEKWVKLPASGSMSCTTATGLMCNPCFHCRISPCHGGIPCWVAFSTANEFAAPNGSVSRIGFRSPFGCKE